MGRHRILLSLAILFVAAAAVFAQPRLVAGGRRPAPLPTPPDPRTSAQKLDETADGDDDDESMIRVATGIVSLPVRVTDRDGRFIGGLQKSDFHVFANEKEQEIAMFANEQEPFTVALVLDMSYSAKFKAEEIQAAALAFIDQLRPADKVMVVSFDQDIYVQCEPTNDRRVLRQAIRRTKISYGTSLYDAMQLVYGQRLRKVKGRKAIVLFSDGVDTSSAKAAAELNLRDATELDALVYPIEYDTFKEVQSMRAGGTLVIGPGGTRTETPGNPVKGTSAEEYRVGHEYLGQLAARTGGRLYKASTPENLADAFSRIASELREYYSIGFYPSDQESGAPRNVKVRVSRQGLVVKTKGN